MSENRNDVKAPIETTQVRAEWQRPAWRKLEAQAAEADVNANTDGAAFS